MTGSVEWVQRLENWYAAQCEGNAEHTASVEIGTIDNPGWSLSVELEDTYLQDSVFHEVREAASELDWCVCRKDGTCFVAWGGANNLQQILEIFLVWADERRLASQRDDRSLYATPSPGGPTAAPAQPTDYASGGELEMDGASGPTRRLENWYAGETDGDWEHTARVSISTREDSGWSVSINVEDTDLETLDVYAMQGDRSDVDRYACRKDGTRFVGSGGPRSLKQMLEIFCNWTDEGYRRSARD